MTFLTAFHTDQFITAASEFPKNTNFFWGDKASWNKSQTKQITDPFGFLGIIFVALDCFHPFRIGNCCADITFFKDVEHRYPVFSSGLHTDIKTIIFKKPIAKTMKVMIVSREKFLLVMWLNAVCSRNNGSYQKAFVDINATAYRINNFQCITLLMI